ncbi:type I restriction enzyme [Capsulimonas corticalis]|uniref:Type I restriction enzyme endonuclease subunit n=1 Tax=Capsulimonas corticalis TaxID=2219043 RepID=A0A402CVX4_9BACT|nr:type I restriction endonuclease subunit R [Capsulimonas corticalis]BDI30542.1 type I restriction enzyme [Capsulimonas corticalis]
MLTDFQEENYVERPFIAQLTAMQPLGWQHIEGDIYVPDVTERPDFGAVLLEGRLRDAIKRINRDESGQEWLDDVRATRMVGALSRLGQHKLMEANAVATNLLLLGYPVEGDPAQHGAGRSVTARFIDFENPANNDFLIINQFRVDVPGGRNYIIPDLVMFVNGIPLVVIECKSPSITNPIEAGITQLLRYSNQRDSDDEGAERLFHYSQLLVSTFFDEARVGTVGAGYEHFLEWKDTYPAPTAQVVTDMGISRLSSQQMLGEGMLSPNNLLNIVKNFMVFSEAGGKVIKIAPRYQQYRAVEKAVHQLEHGQTRTQHGETDQRGGIVWHTQGSGKSLTMVFLVRRMRAIPALRRFKIVVVTDRTDLEKQLKGTAQLTGENVRSARGVKAIETLLSAPGADLVFAMIQKFRDTEGSDDQAAEIDSDEADGRDDIETATALYPELNPSEHIVVLIDEAHRSQTTSLHANLRRALPNATFIGFTGTPILMGLAKRTHEIFGPYIDRYTIRQSEQDGATVRILYEGYDAGAFIKDDKTLDDLADELFGHLSTAERERATARYARVETVLEATNLIAAKADHALRHYVDTVLPNGFKAQIVAVSRLAAVRFQHALVAAQRKLVSEIDGLSDDLLILSETERSSLTDHVQQILRAHPHRNTIAGLEFASVISAGDQNDPKDWAEWTEAARQAQHIARFKKPLRTATSDPAKTDPLAILVVKSMLLTGFDAPNEQALYLDRKMVGAELLQAIARTNRTAPRKKHGLIVDYRGIVEFLRRAVAVYSAEDMEDIRAGIVSIKDTLPTLADRHRRVIAIFSERNVSDISNVRAAVDVLADPRVRADFSVKYKDFLESLDIVLPRPEALHFNADARTLGVINQMARNLYRDPQLMLVGAGQKVRDLIDQHVYAMGIDPKVPPISILDLGFDAAVAAQPSAKTQASEMEHAARYHITSKYNEDPSYYKRLSERLEEILAHFGENWDALVEALRQFTADVREGCPQDQSGLDPRTQAPFLGVLLEETGGSDGGDDSIRRYAEPTVELVEVIRRHLRQAGFWRSEYAQRVLHGEITVYLDDHELIPIDHQERVADRLVALSRTLHARLVAEQSGD